MRICWKIMFLEVLDRNALIRKKPVRNKLSSLQQVNSKITQQMRERDRLATINDKENRG